MRRFWWGLVRYCSFGRIILDPKLRNDKKKKEILNTHADLKKGLEEVKKKLTEETTELDKLKTRGAQDVKNGEVQDKTIVYEIRLKQKLLRLYQARIRILSGKMETAQILVAIIELSEDSQPMQIDPEVKEVSRQVGQHIAGIEEDLAAAHVIGDDVDKTLTVSDDEDDEELMNIAQELVTRSVHVANEKAASGQRPALIVTPAEEKAPVKATEKPLATPANKPVDERAGEPRQQELDS